MALIKDGLWGIVKGTEVAPGEGSAEARRKYKTRRDRALALVVIAVEPSLLHLLESCLDKSGPAPMVRLLQPWSYRFLVNADIKPTSSKPYTYSST